MKKSALLLACLLLPPATGFAQSFDQPTAYIDLHYYAYEEPGVMRTRALLPAVTLGLRDETGIRETRRPGHLSWTLEGTFGYTEYSGSGTHRHNFYKLLAEVYTPVHQNFYLGLGYRRLLDDFGPGRTSTNAGTYDRLSQYFYLPVGATFKAVDGASSKAQFNYFLGGSQISYLTQVPGYLNDPDNTQNSGYGLDFAYTPRHGKWEAYLRYWNIGQSNYVACRTTSSTGFCYEPKNNTVEIGARFAF